MEKIFRPAILLINRFKFMQKFILISLLVILPLGGAIILIFLDQHENIEINQKERFGVEYNTPLKALIVDVQEHREVASSYLKDNTFSKDNLLNLQKQIDKDIKAVDTADQKFNVTLSVGDRWSNAKSKWMDITAKATSLSETDSADLHTDLIGDLSALFSNVADKSNLTLDPDLDSYYCMDVTMFRQMPISEKLNILRNTGTSLVAKKILTADEKKRLIMLSVDIKTLSDTIDGDMQIAIRENKDKTLEFIKQDIQNSLEANNTLLDILNTKVIDVESVGITSQEFFIKATTAINANSRLYDKVSLGLDGLLKVRVDAYTRENSIVIALVAVGFPLVAYLYIAFSISILQSLTLLKKGTTSMAEGDLTYRVNVDTKDEVGELAVSFNSMLEGQVVLLKAVLDSAQVVASASEQLSASTQEMSGNTEVTKEGTEKVAESIELLGASIDSVAKNSVEMRNNVSFVSESLAEMSKAVNDIVDSIQNAVDTIDNVTKSSVEMGESVDNVTQSSKLASAEAQNMVKSAQDGKRDVEKTVFEMDKISQTVERLSLAVKKLGDSASQISEIVDVINDISEQTNLLALNASIEAARAGEHGKGFAVVAGAIRGLSERSQESTKNIIKLVSIIGKEVNDAVTTTEEGSKAINYGVSLVKNTGHAFENIFNTVIKTNELIKNISKSANVQADKSTEIISSIKIMNDMIQSISSTTEEQATSIAEISNSSCTMSNIAANVTDSLQQQSKETQSMVEGVKVVNSAATEISQVSEEVARGTANLAQQAEVLLKSIEKYKFN